MGKSKAMRWKQVAILGMLGGLTMGCSSAPGQLGGSPTISGLIEMWHSGVSAQVEARIWLANQSPVRSLAPIAADGSFQLTLPSNDQVAELAMQLPMGVVPGGCVGIAMSDPPTVSQAELTLAFVENTKEVELETVPWNQQGSDGPEVVSIRYVWSASEAKIQSDYTCKTGPSDPPSPNLRLVADKSLSPGWNSLITHATTESGAGVPTYVTRITRDGPPSTPHWRW